MKMSSSSKSISKGALFDYKRAFRGDTNKTNVEEFQENFPPTNIGKKEDSALSEQLDKTIQINSLLRGSKKKF